MRVSCFVLSPVSCFLIHGVVATRSFPFRLDFSFASFFIIRLSCLLRSSSWSDDRMSHKLLSRSSSFKSRAGGFNRHLRLLFVLWLSDFPVKLSVEQNVFLSISLPSATNNTRYEKQTPSPEYIGQGIERWLGCGECFSYVVVEDVIVYCTTTGRALQISRHSSPSQGLFSFRFSFSTTS